MASAAFEVVPGEVNLALAIPLEDVGKLCFGELAAGELDGGAVLDLLGVALRK